MKKLKFVLSSLILIVLLGFSLIFFPTEVKADSGDWGADLWEAPLSAQNFVDKDGRGIRLAIMYLYADDDGDFLVAEMRTVKSYRFGDTRLDAGVNYHFGKNFFDPVLIHGYLTEVMLRYGEGLPIPDWDRGYVYFDVDFQQFVLEYRGAQYAGYMIDKYLSAYEVGYDDGYSDGHTEGYNYGYRVGESGGFSRGYTQGYDRGYNDGILVGEAEAYEKGYSDGQKSKLAENNEAFYQGIEKWLVPAIIAVIVLGGFVSIAVRKRREE